MARQVTINRMFDAPREVVFRAWTDPKLLAQWWGPQTFTNPLVELDARPGGRMLIHMRAPDGTIYPAEGEFHEVIAPERLVFTSTAFDDADGRPQLVVENTVTFDDLGEKTLATLNAVVVKATLAVEEPLSGMEAGWRESWDKLTRLIATQLQEN
ncbi:MAG TPA: SRPBCC domain-containing protein [Anaerolineaceae bacterium]|nr:SRPBCC domain-containing protein [Anaerolineaceae bacterium]